jgi:hypothetical protein
MVRASGWRSPHFTSGRARFLSGSQQLPTERCCQYLAIEVIRFAQEPKHWTYNATDCRTLLQIGIERIVFDGPAPPPSDDEHGDGQRRSQNSQFPGEGHRLILTTP